MPTTRPTRPGAPTEEPSFEGHAWTRKHGFDTGPVSVGGMIDPAYYEREIEHIWMKLWLWIGKKSWIPEPGQYFIRDLPFARTSIVVTHAEGGEIRAFHNVCSHRCNKIVWQERGRGRFLTCPFHGWAYTMHGALHSIPDEGEFYDLDTAELGLTPVHVETWTDFIFISLAETPHEDLREYLGEIATLYDEFPFASFTEEYHWTVDLKCNWKIARDAFSEVYHVPFVHNRSAAHGLVADDMPMPRALDYLATKYHGRFSMAGNPQSLARPSEALAMRMGALTSQQGGRGRPNNPDLPQLNPTGSPRWYSDLNYVFPHFHFVAFPGFYLQNTFWPVAVDRCVFEMHLNMIPPTTPIERWAQEAGRTQLHAGILEDMSTLENTQSVIASGAKSHFFLQDQEIGVRQSHHWVQRFAGPYPEIATATGSRP